MLPSSINMLGRYQLMREIARSNDIVYEGIDPVLKRRVAIKELDIASSLVGQQRRERIDRFYREAKAAGALQHPGIVTIYEVGEDKGRYFIAMEYLEGQTLRDVLQIRGALPVSEAVEIAAQICDALQYAHERAVIHRDIKPDNVQILPDGRVKLTDFGIARITSEPTITIDGQVFGTPSYMSPEQIIGKRIDHRSDLFSLGIVLYEMLTGRKPFVGDSVVTITYNIMHQEIEMPQGIPPHLHCVLRRALARNLAHRYGSAAEMKADLTRPISVPPHAGQMPSQAAAPVQRCAPASATPLPATDGTSVDDLFADLPPGAMEPPDDWFPGSAFSPAASALLRTMAVIVLIGCMVGFFIWGLRRAYGNYEMTATLAKAVQTYQMGMDLYEAGRYQEAIQVFGEAARLSPNADVRTTSNRMISNCYTMIGHQYLQQGQWAQAAQAYQIALRYDPGNAVAYVQLGGIYEKLGRTGEAGEAWNKAMQLDSKGDAGREARHAMAVNYYNQGVELFNQGRYQEARQMWQKVLETAPESDAAVMAEEQLNALNRNAE